MSGALMLRSSVNRWSVPVCAASLVLLALIAPIGFGGGAWSKALENAFHVPLFAAIAVGVLWWWHAKSRELHTRHYLGAFLFAVALGAITEIAQSFTATRHPEWVDLLNDVCGAALGLSVFALFDSRKVILRSTRRTLKLTIVVTTIVLVTPLLQVGYLYWQQWRQLPNLVTWNSTAGYYSVTATSADLNVVELLRWGKEGELAMQVTPLRDGRWASLLIEEPWADWSAYSQLAIDVVNPGKQPIELLVRINDQQHNNDFDDRFNKSYALAPLTRTTLQLPLSAVKSAPAKRQMDMRAISRVVLFQDADRAAYVLYVCAVRLVP
jgi:uncharacterized protein YfiM (DUF2279 family)